MKLPLSAYLNIASDFVPLGAGIARRAYRKGEVALFFSFVFLGFVVEISTFLLAQRKINNLWILHIYALIEYIILILVFASWQKERPLLRRLLYGSIWIYTLFWILSKYQLERFESIDQYTHSVSALVFVALSVLTLLDQVRTEESFVPSTVPLYGTFRFWVTVGVLIFFSGNTLLFGLGNVIGALAFKDAVAVWTFHWWLNITANICYAIGFLCLKRE